MPYLCTGNTVLYPSFHGRLIQTTSETRFLFSSFRDFLFLLVVAQISYIWFPSELTSKYAYSSQIPTSDFDEFEEGLEMPETGRVPGQNDEFVIGEDDEEDEEDDFDKDFVAEDDGNGYERVQPNQKVALD